MMRSLGARLFAAALLFLFLALLVTWLTLTRLFENHIARQTEGELQAIADTLTANLSIKDGKPVLSKEPADPRFNIPAGGRYWEIDGANKVDIRSRSLWDSDIGDKGQMFAGSNLEILPGPSGDDLLVFTTTARFDDNGTEQSVEIHAASDKSELENALTGFRSELFSMLALTGAFLALASGLQIFVGLHPLRQLRRAVSSLRRGETDAIDIAGPAEVRPLITEINTLMQDGRAAVERARSRASDLAHGLKTPLTILGQLGETMAKEGRNGEAGQIAEQVSTIRARVDRQLALARSGSADRLGGLDAGIALTRLIKAATPIAERQGVALTLEISGDVIVRADMTDFVEATGNVLDNAIRHAQTRVTLHVSNAGRRVLVDVTDDGPGIGQEDRDRVLQRGIRLDEATDGSGLGLAISADILRAYGGSISLGDSAMGGLKVRMDWPLGYLGKNKND